MRLLLHQLRQHLPSSTSYVDHRPHACEQAPWPKFPLQPRRFIGSSANHPACAATSLAATPANRGRAWDGGASASGSPVANQWSGATTPATWCSPSWRRRQGDHHLSELLELNDWVGHDGMRLGRRGRRCGAVATLEGWAATALTGREVQARLRSERNFYSSRVQPSIFRDREAPRAKIILL